MEKFGGALAHLFEYLDDVVPLAISLPRVSLHDGSLRGEGPLMAVC